MTEQNDPINQPAPAVGAGGYPEKRRTHVSPTAHGQ